MDGNQTMNVGFLSASVSRSAGGLYDAMRHLALSLDASDELNLKIFGLKDTHTLEDSSGWHDLSVKVFDTKGPRSFGYAPKIPEALVNDGLDIIHSQGLWMYPSMASYRWSKQTQKPYLISPHGMLDPWAVRNSYWKKRLAGILYENDHLHGAACLHALCESEAKAMRAYGLRNPICIIPNGIHPADDVLDVEPEWRNAIPKGAKVLLYLGRLHPKKGLPQLLDAWAKVQRESCAEKWHLAIAGWDQMGHEKALRQQCESLYLQGRVHFIGAQFGSQKYASYRHADAFILPSFSEGLPMTVLEAWSYSLPVLMTPQCNLPEGFQEKAALRIEPDISSIAQGLIDLFSMNDEALVAIGVKGQLLTKKHFSWPLIAEQMAAVYRWVLGRGAKPDCIFLG